MWAMAPFYSAFCLWESSCGWRWQWFALSYGANIHNWLTDGGRAFRLSLSEHVGYTNRAVAKSLCFGNTHFSGIYLATGVPGVRESSLTYIFQCACANLAFCQQGKAVLTIPHLLHLVLSVFLILVILGGVQWSILCVLVWQCWDWTQGLAFARQVLYPLNRTSNSFCCSYFVGWVSHLCLGWPGLRCSYLHFLIAGMVALHHHSQLFNGWDGVSLTFGPDWPPAAILVGSEPLNLALLLLF
jgi:hypothetical protein